MRLRIAAAALAFVLAACQPNAADSLPQGEGYDFYVLSLSWSPSYCEIEGADANRQQCSATPSHAFVVHGLWPQFERGWPEFCPSDEPERVPNALVNEVLDIMPSAGLIGHQWRKHGSCTGLSQRDYFAVVRAAHEAVAIPSQFERATGHTAIAPDEVEAGFIEANPGLPASGIAVTCHEGYLFEVRLCLGKDLGFRACPEIDARSCPLPRARMPGGQGRPGLDQSHGR